MLVLVLGACTAAHAAVPPGFVGVYADDSYFGTSPYRQAQMAAQRWLGVQTVRQPFEWFRVERTPGSFDWAAYDGYVADAARAGLNVLPVLVGPPKFRSSRPKRSRSKAMFPPKSNADYARFVSSAVARYGPNGSFWSEHPEIPFVPIRSWQIWNEPNIRNFWRSGPNPRRYVQLLRAGSRAVRALDPQAEVVAAGLPNSKNLGIPFLHFAAGMYRAGAKGSFDTLAIHPYARSAAGVVALTERARSLMNHYHDHASLWITEFGWSTSGDASAFRVSRQGQAARIAEAISALVAEQRDLRLRGFVFFKWKDSIAPPNLGKGDPWPLHAGLLSAKNNPKPGFWAFGRSVAQLSQPPSPGTGGSSGPVRVQPREVRLSPRGYAPVVVACRSEQPGACAGTLHLRTSRRLSCGSAQRARGSRIGSASFRIAASPSLVPVRLSHTLRTLAKCAGRVRVRATVSPRPSGPGAKAVTFVISAR
jgi:hypothetical protein